MIVRPIRQVAYFVRDAEAAARRHAALFGSGPFLLAERIPLLDCRHRGRPAPLDHSSAYGQWGEVMVEFVQQNDDAPSAFHDCFPDGAEGIHHVAVFADDLAAEIAAWRDADYEEAFQGETAPGTGFAFIDTRPLLGHMLELYEPTPALTGFYAKVRDLSLTPREGDVIRRISFSR